MYPGAVAKILACFALCLVLSAGTAPKQSANDYPVHAAAASAEIGAEFMGRTIEHGGDAYFPSDYLVIDVAVYAARELLDVRPADFKLRLNGANFELSPDTAESVAAALRNPGLMGRQRGVVATGDAGPADVIIGGPGRGERFPGDPQARRVPQPTTGQPPVTTRTVAEAGAEAAKTLALESGRASTKGASGLIYFHWSGKLKALKRVELIYRGAGGTATLRLR